VRASREVDPAVDLSEKLPNGDVSPRLNRPPDRSLHYFLMPKEEDKEMSFDIWCDLSERELTIALEDLRRSARRRK
jgi:hypothetical protein